MDIAAIDVDLDTAQAANWLSQYAPPLTMPDLDDSGAWEVLAGDVGFGPWAAAKRACYDAVEAGYTAVFGGADNVDGDQKLVALDEEFPVPGEIYARYLRETLADCDLIC